MSVYSGVCDLSNFLEGLGGWYDKDGNPVKFGQEGVFRYYSDELKDFEEFKRKTGGVIYQHHKIKVEQYNQEFVKKHCKEFDFIEHEPDETNKRKYYTYKYYNQEYNNLKELNKQEVYVELEIHFDTLLDLIPYYPYIVIFSASDKDHAHIVISNESSVEEEFKERLQNGHTYGAAYKKELQNHYIEVCKKYFLYKLEERTKRVSLLKYKPLHNGYYEILLDTPADYMHEPRFVWKDGKAKAHWSDPKISDVESNVLLVAEGNIDYFLAEDIKTGNVEIEYVEKCEFPLELS